MKFTDSVDLDPIGRIPFLILCESIAHSLSNQYNNPRSGSCRLLQATNRLNLERKAEKFFHRTGEYAFKNFSAFLSKFISLPALVTAATAGSRIIGNS